MGSKNRIAKDILPFLMKNLSEKRYYVEPFCGGCNMIDKVKHNKRIAGDANNYLIAMWRFLVYYNFDFPKDIKKESYSFYRDIFNKRKFAGNGYTDTEALIGWIGFMGSFNGRFFDGGYSGNNVKGRNYIDEQISNTIRQVDKLKGVEFCCGSYDKIKIPDKSIIYCDPPYQGTKQYLISKQFNHELFWQWCREMTYKGHEVIISEYHAPDDFFCMWEKGITNAINTNKTYKPIERLFVHKSIKNKYLKKNKTYER